MKVKIKIKMKMQITLPLNQQQKWWLIINYGGVSRVQTNRNGDLVEVKVQILDNQQQLIYDGAPPPLSPSR